MHQLPDYLLSRGYHIVTAARAAALTGVPIGHVYPGLRRLKQARKLASPAKGLYVVIPSEYRAWGMIPGEWFIDAMMEHLDRRYYVALLSAASILGAAPQPPQVFQVMVDRPLRDRDLGRVRLRFYHNSRLGDAGAPLPVERRNVPTGYLLHSNVELTAVDLVDRPYDAGGLSHVVTVLAELPSVSGDTLASVAAAYPRAVARRLGWLLQRLGRDVDLQPLLAVAQPGEGEPDPLDPRRPHRRGDADPRWGVRVNTLLDPDLHAA